MTIRTGALDRLPVRGAVPALLRALDEHGVAVLCAPPGTGKTTLVPLAVAGLLDDGRPVRRVIVAEPRRIAARAAARRMAWLLGESLGDAPGEGPGEGQGPGEGPGERRSGRVGFTVRGERRAGPDTVVEVVTTGVLLQRLQRDPELSGIDTVILDECHERHLDADTVAAFLLDVRATLRPDLRLIAASATTDAAGWARLLGGDSAGAADALGAAGGSGEAPVIEAEGASHPVAVVWAPPARPVRPPHGMRVDPELLAHVASVVRRALAEHSGDVLCFLPGVGEIARVAGLLDGCGAEVFQVHGRAPAAVQDAVLAGRPAPRNGRDAASEGPDAARAGAGGADGAGTDAGTGGGTRSGRQPVAGAAERRVVLATSVAESSLTVPGVRIVVDSGLAREPRVDHARGLSALTTVRASQASARQRAGRAGREAPGVVYRCWSEADDARLPRWPSPEIAVADLTAFALQAACWGDPDASGLALLDPPPSGAMAAAREVLAAIGAVDAQGKATERGSRLTRLGLHPRLGRALLDGAREVGARRAAEIVALLSEEPPRNYGDDLAAAWRTARRGGDGYAARWRQEARRLERAVATTTARKPARAASASAPASASASASAAEHGPAEPSSVRTGGGEDAVAGLIAALAFPERVARARGGRAYLMAAGTGAETAEGSGLRGAPWLAVAVADRPVTSASARIRLAAVIDEGTARRAASALHYSGAEVGWADGDVVAREVERLGAVELTARPLASPDPVLLREAVLTGLRREGPRLLRWTAEAGRLRERLAFLRRAVGEPWPDVSDAALLERADEWLEPELSAARRRADLARIDAGAALGRLLPWATGEAARLDELAPERIEVPSGSRVRVDYGEDQPVLAVKLQEMFGLAETPRVAGVPVLVHLLSPAGRPAAVTADLASFWKDGYRSVRAELRGRYPKHPWPEDPSTAQATRRTNARR